MTRRRLKLKLKYYTDKELALSLREDRMPRITGLAKIAEYVTSELNRKINRKRAGQILIKQYAEKQKIYKLTENEIIDIFNKND